MTRIDHPVRARILRSFARQRRRVFVELERAAGVRSNHAAYHVATLVRDGFLRKTGREYALTASGQRLLIAMGKTTSETPLPIVLAVVRHAWRIALIRRAERPYAGRLALPGGRLRLGETLPEAATRLARSKAGLEVIPSSVSGVAVERLLAKDGLAHSFLLIAVDCRLVRDNGSDARWYPRTRLPSTVIRSDAALARCTHRVPFTVFDVPEGHKGF